MDRDGVEASLMFPPIIAMQVGEPELRNACVQAYNDWAFDSAKPRRSASSPSPCYLPSTPQRRAMKSSVLRSWVSAKRISWSTMSLSK